MDEKIVGVRIRRIDKVDPGNEEFKIVEIMEAFPHMTLPQTSVSYEKNAGREINSYQWNVKRKMRAYYCIYGMTSQRCEGLKWGNSGCSLSEHFHGNTKSHKFVMFYLWKSVCGWKIINHLQV